MTKREFLKAHRDELRQLIERHYDIAVTNDSDTWDYVMNDEGLYRWAKSEGVNI